MRGLTITGSTLAVMFSASVAVGGTCAPDTMPPFGRITAPEPHSCHGPAALPVLLADDFADACDPHLDRVYAPQGRLRLTASDGARRDSFGGAISLYGDVLVVGASFDGDRGTWSGSAYVFRRRGERWIEEQKLTASDGAAYDHFGNAVSVADGLLVVGALRHDARGADSGAAYVFRRTASGWIEEQKLAASDGAIADTFGYSVATDGTTIVVGARGHDHGDFDAGAAYVFRQDGAGWIETQKLTSDAPARGQVFGTSVSVDGDTLVVGAVGDDPLGMENAGAAYVFRRGAAGWGLEQRLVASDRAPYDLFGLVSIDGDTIVVGARGSDSRGSGSGSAYVFRRYGSVWIQLQRLTASDGAAGDGFGTCAIHAGHVVVGAIGDDDRGSSSGSAYVFRPRGPFYWAEDAKLVAPDGRAGDRFGQSVTLHGDLVAVGAHLDSSPEANSGSVWVHGGTGYGQHGDLLATLTVTDDAGNSVVDAVPFTVDIVPPAVRLLPLEPDRILLPLTIPFSSLFEADDEDGAAGEVLVERMYLDDCLIFDGLDYGDGDGLLRDESATFDKPTLCGALARCDWSAADGSVLRVDATDCGDNRGTASRSLPVEIGGCP